MLHNCFKSKDSGISISEDFSAAVCETRRKLWEPYKNERSKGNKVTLVFNMLKVDDDLFVWDDTENKQVLLNNQEGTTSGTASQQD